ncbi:major facilitator superfamily domain-containing protein [Mycena sp. CBHHK59/15]|nr:major facilitator superfamily domain-containing protein [Mycena sp. CBHHK59/15]
MTSSGPNTNPHLKPSSIHGRSGLEEYEREGDGKPPFILTYTEVKLLGIAGVGVFHLPVSTMLQYRLYDGNALPAGLQGFLKAGANIGSVIGQFAFGYLADALGRKAIYGKELMLVIFATSCSLSPDNSLIYLTVFRIILGIGVGGDYPMSASITSDRAVLRKRGTMLAYIFSNQGWGSLVGSLSVMDGKGETSKVDGVWRIVVGLSLIPAFGTLYQRLTLPESTRFIESQKEEPKYTAESDSTDESKKASEEVEIEGVIKKKAHSVVKFLIYFSEWRHAKMLIGTCICWFLLDIAFYGINLNQNVVPLEKLFKISTGNIIITALGFLGRKWIQIQGFLLAALFLAILAGKFHTLSKPGFIVCFSLLQVCHCRSSRNFCYPAEVFPTRFRAFAHGLSAASGKVGAIISALAFNSLSEDIGTDKVLWIFVGCCIAGAGFTLLLPEVRARDPDLILAQEIEEARTQRK